MRTNSFAASIHMLRNSPLLAAVSWRHIAQSYDMVERYARCTGFGRLRILVQFVSLDAHVAK